MNKEPNSARVSDPSMVKLIEKLLSISSEIVSSQVVTASTRLKKDIVQKAIDIMQAAQHGKKINNSK